MTFFDRYSIREPPQSVSRGRHTKIAGFFFSAKRNRDYDACGFRKTIRPSREGKAGCERGVWTDRQFDVGNL